MKKIFSYFTIIVCVLVFANMKSVSAAEMKSSDIPNSTYVIGKSMFTRDVSDSYSGSLSTDVIMLAAKTIDSNKLEDMIIYYKNARGTWVNALTNNEIEVPEKFDIQYKNNVVYVEIPTIGIGAGSGNSLGTYGGVFNIIIEGEYADLIQIEKLSGFELYEKNNDEYILLESVTKEDDPYLNLEYWLEVGQTKTVVGRVYALDSKGNKVYSDYSNEIKLSYMLETPTLKPVAGSIGIADLSIVAEGTYATEESWGVVSGWELYEKVGTNYNLVKSQEGFNTIEVTIDAGETKTYVAKVYALNSKGNKVYSNYSNEIELKNLMETPTLAMGSGSGNSLGTFGGGFNVIFEGAYASEAGLLKISGWELYEKNGEKYTLLKSVTKEDDPYLSLEYWLEAGQTKTVVGRVYALNSKGNKVYSDYSNEIKLSYMLETPTLKPVAGSIGIADLSIVAEGTYAKEESCGAVSGWELYEKVGTNYNLVKSQEGLNTIQVTIDAGETKTYVAKVYALNSKGNKVYSDYSNVLTIGNSN